MIHPDIATAGNKKTLPLVPLGIRRKYIRFFDTKDPWAEGSRFTDPTFWDLSCCRCCLSSPLHFYGPPSVGRSLGRSVSGVRSHLLRHCRDGHWMGRVAAARMGTGLPESGGFHSDLIFWEMLSSAVMLLVVAPPASIVASRITPIFFCSSFPGEKLMLSPYG